MPYTWTVADTDSIRLQIELNTDTVVIDGADQIDGPIVSLCRELAEKEFIDVIVGARELSEDGTANLKIGALMCDAEHVEKKLSPCVHCQRETNRWTLRTTEGQSELEVICRECQSKEKRNPSEDSSPGSGRLTVVVGPAGAGKSVELVRVVKNCLAAKHKPMVFYPGKYSGLLPGTISASTGDSVVPKKIETLEELFDESALYGVCDVFLDSLHAFSTVDTWEAMAKKFDRLVARRVNVYLTSWGTDTRAKAYPLVAALLCLAEEIVVMEDAPCAICKLQRTTRTQKSAAPNSISPQYPNTPASNLFEARCRHHHQANP